MERIKVSTGHRVLANKIKNRGREVVVCNIQEARHIGIIYNASEYVSFELIRNLVKKLTSASAKVNVLGYVNSKELIDHYLYRKGFDFFSRNNLNWYYKPASETTEQFIRERFDILLNLSLEDHFPIRYITALSAALFKAGRYSADDPFLDFMIDIEKEKQTMKNLQREIMKDAKQTHDDETIEANVEKKTETELQLGFLIDQLLYYLSIIKK
jgi:hypothetical protein